jgi:predicted metal-dependent RNase
MPMCSSQSPALNYQYQENDVVTLVPKEIAEEELVEAIARDLAEYVAAEQTGSTRARQVSAQDAAQQPAPAAAAISPQLVQQFEEIARDLAVMRKSVEQLAAKQEQMAQNIASLQTVEQSIR